MRVELDGIVLAESPAPVMVFETGLPTRYYLDPTEINSGHLIPSGTVTSCPYKGTTSRYWSVRAGDMVHPDLAWAYDFPTRQLQPIAGLVAFYNEKVDLFLGGQRLQRPKTHFFASADSPDTPERGSGTAPLVPALPARVTALFARPLNRYRPDL